MAPDTPSPRALSGRAGHLVVIGGNEDREHDKLVLRRFVELTGQPDPRLLLLTAAGAGDQGLAELYRRAFAELGAIRCTGLELASREQANDPANADRLLNADGIFITGSDQKRLLAVIGGTAVHHALHQAFEQMGRCIAGTSAAASALSQHMLQDGGADNGSLAAGLGLLQRAVIDQHFSERQRLGRLLQVVAHNPTLIGVGIDEDTALVIAPAGGVEAVGDGAVTLLDGRQMSSSFLPGRQRDALELIDVKLHLLPAGARYAPGAAPPVLQSIATLLTRSGSALS